MGEGMSRKAGRPSNLDKPGYREKLEEIIDELGATSKSLRTLCKEFDIDIRQFLRSIQSDELLNQQYVRARRIQSELHHDEILDIINEDVPFNDMAAVQMKRLKIDTLKWSLGKMQPKRFGDKMEVEQNVNINSTLTVAGVDAFMNKLLDAASSTNRIQQAFDEAEEIGDLDGQE